MNVSTTAFQLGTGVKYFPHFYEIVVSISIVSIGFFLFYLAVRFLPVFPEGPLKEINPRNPIEEFNFKKIVKWKRWKKNKAVRLALNWF